MELNSQPFLILFSVIGYGCGMCPASVYHQLASVWLQKPRLELRHDGETKYFASEKECSRQLTTAHCAVRTPVSAEYQMYLF